MIEARIAEVRVRVRTDIPDATEIRPAAERMVRAALGRCAELLEEKAPGRIVFIRRLPLHWRQEETVVDDATHIEELARAAADTIERISRPPVIDPPPSDDGAVIFDDEAHLRASQLVALARGRSAWFYAALEDPEAVDPLATLAAPERRATAQATLFRLAREGVLAEVLAARPSPAVAVFAAALGCDLQQVSPPVQPIHAEVDRRDLVAGHVDRVAELRTIASNWPTLTPPARLLALRVHAAVLLDAEFATPQAIALANAVLLGSSPLSVKSPELEDDAPVAQSPELAATSFEPEDAAEIISTRCGGLFYLCACVQELDLAESLWKACLPEGVVLAAAASALLGPAFADDAAPTLFGGITAIPACPEVTSEQHAEIAVTTCAALAAALPRRELADIPPAFVRLVEHPTGRLLVVTADNLPFAFFAWPAATPERLLAGLRALLDTWPHQGTLTATPALASLDTSGRLRPTHKDKPHSLFLPNASSSYAVALLSLVAGAPALLFATRAGDVAIESVEAFVTHRLAYAARVQRRAERIDVIFSSDAFDLDVRRAGLDRDPGWLPWLQRTVRFVFEERGPEGGERA